jgi:hypothetical protein
MFVCLARKRTETLQSSSDRYTGQELQLAWPFNPVNMSMNLKIYIRILLKLSNNMYDMYSTFTQTLNKLFKNAVLQRIQKFKMVTVIINLLTHLLWPTYFL